MIRPNGSLFTYTINQIYDSNNLSETVSSFLYYNNPLSSCDIVRHFGDVLEGGLKLVYLLVCNKTVSFQYCFGYRVGIWRDRLGIISFCIVFSLETDQC